MPRSALSKSFNPAIESLENRRLLSASAADSAQNSEDYSGGQGVTTTFNAETVLQAGDGKIFVAGHKGNASAHSAEAVLERRNADGTVDTKFAKHGESVTLPASNQTDFAATEPDASHVVTAGSVNGEFAVTRYGGNGAPDASFGKKGTQATNLGADAAAYSVAATSDGGLVAAGGAGGNFAFARYDGSGNLVSGFGQDGVEVLSPGSGSGVIGAVSVQADGSVLAAGSSAGNIALVRLGADGAPDASFGDNGIAVVQGLAASQGQSDGPDRSEGLFVQSDGKVLIANHTSDNRMAVARLNADGTPDASFGDNGIASASFGGTDDADQVIVAPNGTILVIGTTSAGGIPSIAVAAFDSGGNPFTGFGADGRYTAPAEVTPITRELHVGDLVLRAFGTLDSKGALTVGASGTSSTSPVTAVLHRVIVTPGVAGTTLTELGSFGISGRQNQKLRITAADGTHVTFSLAGGSATAFETTGGKIQLQVTDAGHGAALSISTGGAGRVTLGDVAATGSLKSFSARTADLSGTLAATGTLGRIALGNITGTIAAGGGALVSLSAASLSHARVFSGAAAGADGQISAVSSAFGAGSIGSISVSGSIVSSIIGAGLKPASGATLVAGAAGHHYTVAGGASSRIGSIFAKAGADATTQFVAGAFGSIRLPKKIDPVRDARFITSS